MALTTTNLSLTLPGANEPADISALNGNFKKIDEKCNPALFAPANKATLAALSAPYAFTAGQDGFGAGIVIHDDKTCMLFDMGNDNGASLMEYLDENGIQRIDAIFVSHFHSDHFQRDTLKALCEGYEVQRLIMPHTAIDWTRAMTQNAPYKTVSEEAETVALDYGVNVHKPIAEGASFALGAFRVSCHNVSADQMEGYYDWHYNEVYDDKDCPNYNNFCMVNVVEYAGKKLVITGDIMEPAVENNLDVIGVSDLITVPHHGLDRQIAHTAFHRLSAQHALIPSAYDPSGILLHTSRIFAGELLRRGCRVTTNYDGQAAVYEIGVGGIKVVSPGALAGHDVYPCILEPGCDLDALPDGEYITYTDLHAATFQDVVPLVTKGRKFKLKVETTNHAGTAKTQTLENADTGAVTEMAKRMMTGGAYGPWGLYLTADAFMAKEQVSTDAEADMMLLRQIGMMGEKTHRRILMSLTAALESIGLGGHWDTDIFKQTENYAIITARTYLRNGVTIQRVWFEGVLYPWEWVNPQMAENVEYRTTQRHNGKPVYTKLVKYTNPEPISGQVSMLVPHGVTGLGMLLSAEGTTSGYLIPYAYGGNTIVPSAWDAENLVVYVNWTGSAWDAGRNWYFTLRYTKA